VGGRGGAGTENIEIWESKPQEGYREKTLGWETRTEGLPKVHHGKGGGFEKGRKGGFKSGRHPFKP